MIGTELVTNAMFYTVTIKQVLKGERLKRKRGKKIVCKKGSKKILITTEKEDYMDWTTK